jgi:hypothetical protein
LGEFLVFARGEINPRLLGFWVKTIWFRPRVALIIIKILFLIFDIDDLFAVVPDIGKAVLTEIENMNTDILYLGINE